MALLDQPSVQTHAPITEAEAKQALSTGYWSDDPALKLVIQDSERAENFESTKQFVMGWPSATALYQSPFTSRYWEGTQTERANVPFFTVAGCVEALIPQIINGLFYENPPFLCQQRPKTSSQAARAVQAILGYQLEDIKFQEEIRRGAKNCVLFGTGIWKMGWETSTREIKEYVRKDHPVTIANQAGLPDISLVPEDEQIEEKTTTEYVDRPTFEHIVNLRHVLVDPGLNVPDIQKAKYVVHRMYMTWEQLNNLRDRPGFTIPSKEELLELFFPPKEQPEAAAAEVSIRNPLWDARSEARYVETTADPFNQPLEVLERWDKNKYTVVLQKKLVLCHDDNPYGQIPFLSVGWWDVPEAFWSIGLAKTIGAEQRLQQGVTNAWLDNLSLNLNGVYVRVMGKSTPTQSIRVSPGKIVNVENKGDFEVLDRLPSVPEALQSIAMSQSRAEQLSGAGDITSQGIAGSSGHSNLARSATGANLLGSGQSSKVQDFVGKLADNVIVPFLYFAHAMNSALLPASTLRYILDEELQHEWKSDVVELMNARVKFSISAASRMQARRNMAQALPIMLQFLNSPQIVQSLAVEGKKLAIDEILRMLWEVSDWKNLRDVVVVMTPQDQQRWAASQGTNQIQQKTQAQASLQDQKFQQAQQLLDQENFGRAARDTLRRAIETSTEPEAVSGQPGAGTQGFGSNT